MILSSRDVAVRHLVRERWTNRLRLLGLWAIYAAAVGLGTVVGPLRLTTPCLGGLGMLFGTAFIIGRSHGAPVAGVRTKGEPGTVSIDDDGLTVTVGSRTRHFARGDVESGWTERFMAFADDVVLQMRSGEIVRARTDDQDQARAVLRAAGVAPEQRAVTLRLGVAEPSAERVLAVFLALITGLIAMTAIVAMAAFALSSNTSTGVYVMVGVTTVLTLVAFRILFRPLLTSTLRIGTDGIAIERLFGREFIPRRSFRGVTVTGRGDLAIAAEPRGAVVPVSTYAEAATVAARIEEAMATLRADAAEHLQRKLDRGGRGITQWLRELRASTSGTAGYRIAAQDLEGLASVLEDGAAPKEQRIAAAAALARDEAGRQRVRVVAEACADERLRAAIEEAAEEEIDEAPIRAALR